MTDSLVARLREAIDAEEARARAVTDEHWREDVAEGGHWNEFDEQVSDYLLARPPKVTLRRCAADRKIVDRAEQVLNAGADDRDADGVLLSVPIARRHMRAIVRDLAEAYGVEA